MASPPLERVFDEVYYRAVYGHMIGRGTDEKAHFAEIGSKRGFNPNVFFSSKHYMSAYPEVAQLKEPPFEHFLSSGARIGAVSPLFDPVYYAQNNPDAGLGKDLFRHYFDKGSREGRSPNVLFDVAHYRAQIGTSVNSRTDLLTHYLTEGWKKGLSPHPLFDPKYYVSQLTEDEAKIPPLAHYLEAGWKRHLSPHVLFDPKFYEATLEAPPEEASLAIYLKSRTWDNAPHYLFSDEVYVAAVENSPLHDSVKRYRLGPPLVHFVQTGARYGISPHPLFDVGHYRQVAERVAREQGGPDEMLGMIEENALVHYCLYGFEEGLSPTPLFDPQFYKSQIGERIECDPFRHYSLMGHCVASPHPGIDLDFYARQRSDFVPADLPVLLDILLTPAADRVSPHPSFDPQFYLDRNSDIRDSGTCPILHFLEHGMKEARQPNRMFTYPYAHRLCQPDNARYSNPVDGYFRAMGHKRKRVLFLGHDGSRSGAPLVLLSLIKQLSAIQDIECITIMGRGGPLVDEHVEVSLTYVAENQDIEFLEWGRHSASFRAEMSTIADELEANPPELIVCNSLEARHLGHYFHSRGMGPIVTLVHEVADPYDTTQLSQLLNYSTQSIFVSKYQFGRMQKKLAFDESKSAIVQFGALDPRFGSGDRKKARRKLRRDLGISSDAIIVLGCGTMNFRKGIDLFAEVASAVLERLDGEKDVHFVWVGGGETHYDSAFYWAQKTLVDAGFEPHAHFVGAKSDTEPYYLAADLFLLPSRADPFPCVIQEAMACGLPIVSFEDKSGAAEAYVDSGICVPFGIMQMAKATLSLINDAQDRERRRQRTLELFAFKPSLSQYASAVFAKMASSAPTISAMVANNARKVPADKSTAQRVLLAVEDWDYNETSLYAQHAVRSMIEGGLDAELLFIKGQRAFDRGERPIDPPSVPFGFLYPKSQSADHIREQLHQKLAGAEGDIAFVPFSNAMCYNFLSSLPPHVAAIEILHSPNEETFDRLYAFSHYLDGIVCTSPTTARLVAAANPNLVSKLGNIATQIPTPTATKMSSRQSRKDKEPNRAPIAIAFAQPGNVNAALASIRLARVLREMKVPFTLTLFVDQSEARAVRSIAADLVLARMLTLLIRPSKSVRAEMLAKSHIFIAPPASDGSEISIVEGLAAGCLPIMTQVRSLQSVILKHGETAMVFEDSNIRTLATAIAGLHRDGSKLQRMRAGAHRYFLDTFADPEAAAQQFGETVRKALASDRQRDERWTTWESVDI